MPDLEITRKMEKVFCPRGASDEALLQAAQDADALDPMSKLSGNLIRQMPKHKLIQSEGVGFNGIDCRAAKEKRI